MINLDIKRPDGSLPGGFIQFDLTDAGEVYDALIQTKPDWVCHLAANPSPSGYPRQQTFANNVLSTYNVMQAAGDLEVKRLVYASSEMATGWLTTDELPPRFPFNEEDRVPSPNAYALNKFLGEPIADSMVVRYPELAICSTFALNGWSLHPTSVTLQHLNKFSPRKVKGRLPLLPI